MITFSFLIIEIEYNAVLSKIGDPLEYKAAEKTKEYFYQEFLLDGTDNKDNGGV